MTALKAHVESGRVVLDEPMDLPDGTVLNWPTLQALLLQSVAVEPGTTREVLSELLAYGAVGYSLDVDRIAATLANIVVRHAPLDHGSEVAWALWMHIQLPSRSMNMSCSLRRV